MLLIAVGIWLAPYLANLHRNVQLGDSIAHVVTPTEGWTLVAFLDPGCEYCTASMPLYRSIRERYQTVSFVAAGNSLGPLTEYCKANGLSPTRHEQVTGNRLRVPVTPSLLLMDRQGIVRGFWFGQLTPRAEKVLLSTLERAAANKL